MRAVLLNVPTAQVADGELRLQQFHSDDPEVVALIAGADDPEETVRRALSVGAHAMTLAADPAGEERGH